MDHARRQVARPGQGQFGQVLVDGRRQAGLEALGGFAVLGEQGRPVGLAQVVGAAAAIAFAGQVQVGQTLAGLAAVGGGRTAHRQAGQELDQGGGLAANGLQRAAGAVGDRRGAGKALVGQPTHQVQEIWQVFRRGALFVDRQDEPPTLRLQQEVGVLHALGDALERQGLPQVEVGQEGGKFFVGDVGIDGHDRGMRDPALAVKRSPRSSAVSAA